MNSRRTFAYWSLVVVLSLFTTVSQALTVNDRVSPATDNGGLNVRNCAGMTCSVVKAITDSETGTIIGGGVQADGYTWYNVTWDTNLTGWSAGLYLHQLLVVNDRVDSGSGLNVRSCADTTCSLVTTLTSEKGTVVENGTPGAGYLWNKVSWDTGDVGWSAAQYLTKIGVVASPPPSPPTTVNPPSSPPPVTVDAMPVITLSQSDYTLKEGGSVTFAGSASDDMAIKNIIVNVKNLNGQYVTAYDQEFNDEKVDLDQFSFIASTEQAYYGGTGTYEVQFKVYDALGQEDNKRAFITVTTDYSLRIQELKEKLSSIKQSITAKIKSKDQVNSEKSPLASNVSSDATTLSKYENQLNNTTTLFNPTTPSTRTNTLDQPNGCVIVDKEEIPSEIPLPGEYQAIAHCYQHAGGKGDVYLLYGFTQAPLLSCAVPANSSFAYPAVVLFVPRTDSTALALSQVVENINQATFWIAFYKIALDTSLSTAIANAKQSQLSTPFEYLDETELSQIKSNYLVFRTELRDYLEDTLYEIDETLTEEDVSTLMSILSASLGSIPYIQYAKGAVELCSGEDILTSEPVTIKDSLWYVIPAGKVVKEYTKLRQASPIVKKVMGDDSSSARGFSQQLLDQSARKSAHELGEIGEVSVRRSHDIGPEKKTRLDINGNTRIPDGYSLDNKTISEVKNRKKVSCTSQLRDFTKHAKENIPTLTFQLFVPIGRKAEMLKNPSFLPGGKCYPVTIIEDVMM